MARSAFRSRLFFAMDLRSLSYTAQPRLKLWNSMVAQSMTAPRETPANGERHVAITEDDVRQAEARMACERDHAHVVSARYDGRTHRIIVHLHSGLELAIPPHLVEGLTDATSEALADIEVSPSGLGLHWPQLDADLYVPALLQGQFGSTLLS